ncbi:MAG: hypothetical protein AB7V39_00535 [Nitrospiraceae bacterium]
MAQTNMDVKKNPNATAPVLEFILSESEVDDNLKVGQHGSLNIPVEVVSVGDGMYTFRKTEKAVSAGFKEETLDEERARLIRKQEEK